MTVESFFLSVKLESSFLTSPLDVSSFEKSSFLESSFDVSSVLESSFFPSSLDVSSFLVSSVLESSGLLSLLGTSTLTALPYYAVLPLSVIDTPDSFPFNVSLAPVKS